MSFFRPGNAGRVAGDSPWRRVWVAGKPRVQLTTMGRTERTREMARRRTRREKVKKLRARYAAAKSATEKAEIREKLLRVSPLMTLED